MVRTAVIGLWAATAVAAAATPHNVINQNFQTLPFPPSGWRVESAGNAEGSWARGQEGSDYYAYGYANGGHNYWSVGYLITGYHVLSNGDYLNVKFDYAGSFVGTISSQGRWFMVRKDGAPVITRGMNITEWTTYTERIGPIAGGGNGYDFCWEVYNSGNSWMGPGGTAYFSVDDISITRDCVAVGPASFGRIKALYR